ncbi:MULTISPECIES: restriction endonuclease subunit S [unclassified Bradyrhizobium]|uniref:restriction endonuclease subunit S n=1 Tax=unclassified Bradyrhizobium TaxID=2631580 RepID=UPI0028EBEEC0|nr:MULTISPECIES: restriction endonuclease subunit S [unclassified Bradyrhizobium]
MTSAMPRVQLKEFLTPNLRPHTLAPDQDANLVGMRWYGGGPFHREYKHAHKIQKKSHFVIRSGDVIYNKLFAWKGSFGVVPDELDGMFVSDKFPTYELDRKRTDPRYLAWYFRHHDIWDQAQKKSTGSAAISKLTLNPPQFLELNAPLPALKEQLRIADLLDQCSQRIESANALRAASLRSLEAITQSAANALLGRYSADARLGSVLVHPPKNGWSPKCDNNPEGTPVLTLSAVTGWVFDPSAIKRTSLPTSANAQYWLETGDLLITRSNTPELVGHVAIYNGDPKPCIYPDLMMKLKIDLVKADPKFVWWWMQTRRVRDYIKKNSKGTSPTMKKIAQPVVASVPFPSSISISDQIELASKLDELHSKATALRMLQEDTASALSVLMPALLSKAFDGHL